MSVNRKGSSRRVHHDQPAVRPRAEFQVRVIADLILDFKISEERKSIGCELCYY